MHIEECMLKSTLQRKDPTNKKRIFRMHIPTVAFTENKGYFGKKWWALSAEMHSFSTIVTCFCHPGVSTQSSQLASFYAFLYYFWPIQYQHFALLLGLPPVILIGIFYSRIPPCIESLKLVYSIRIGKIGLLGCMKELQKRKKLRAALSIYSPAIWLLD